MDVTVEHNVPAGMRDGTVLRADVYVPIAGWAARGDQCPGAPVASTTTT